MRNKMAKYIPNKLLIMRLTVNGKNMYEAAGEPEMFFSLGFDDGVAWQGTIQDAKFKKNASSLENLPTSCSEAKDLLARCAQTQYKEETYKIEIAA